MFPVLSSESLGSHEQPSSRSPRHRLCGILDNSSHRKTWGFQGKWRVRLPGVREMSLSGQRAREAETIGVPSKGHRRKHRRGGLGPGRRQSCSVRQRRNLSKCQEFPHLLPAPTQRREARGWGWHQLVDGHRKTKAMLGTGMKARRVPHATQEGAHGTKGPRPHERAGHCQVSRPQVFSPQKRKSNRVTRWKE